jgi:hypothetical protein
MTTAPIAPAAEAELKKIDRGRRTEQEVQEQGQS